MFVSFTHSFVHHIFPVSLLCTRYHARHWGYRDEQTPAFLEFTAQWGDRQLSKDYVLCQMSYANRLCRVPWDPGRVAGLELSMGGGKKD